MTKFVIKSLQSKLSIEGVSRSGIDSVVKARAEYLSLKGAHSGHSGGMIRGISPRSLGSRKLKKRIHEENFGVLREM